MINSLYYIDIFPKLNLALQWNLYQVIYNSTLYFIIYIYIYIYIYISLYMVGIMMYTVAL